MIDRAWQALHLFPLEPIMDTGILNKWLKTGYMEKEVFHPTEEQGGIISPTLANMTLNGLEQAVKSVVSMLEKD